MRISPIILTKHPIHNSIRNCDLSNPNDNNRQCNIIYIKILIYIFRGYNKQKIMRRINKYIQKKEITKDIQQVINDSFIENNNRDITGKNKGWVCHALYIALNTFWYYNNFEDAMEKIVNIKYSDTDTNAEICGNLFGAYLGYDKMKNENLTNSNIEILKNQEIFQLLDKNIASLYIEDRS
jgi:ADP-ribosylglycohydrolase